MSLADRSARMQIVVGAIAVALGAVAVFMSAPDGLTPARGAIVGTPELELKFLRVNLLGALVTVGIGAVGIAAGVLRQRALATVVAAASVLWGLLILVQWRSGTDSNLTGAGGETLSVCLALALVYGVTAWTSTIPAGGSPSRSDDPTNPTDPVGA